MAKSTIRKKFKNLAQIRWVRVFLVVFLITAGVWVGMVLGGRKDSNSEQEDFGIPTMANEVELWYPAGSESTASAPIQAIGRVQTTQSVTVLAEKPGTIQQVRVQEGQVVQEGETLFTLTSSDESLALAQAQESLSQSRIAFQTIQEEFFTVGGSNIAALQNQQSAQVAAAREALLTTDLQAYAADPFDANSVNPPVISGTYNSDVEGEYKISVYSSASESGASFTFEGLEEGIQSISSLGSVPLGTKGLRIEFPNGARTGSEWIISIPNTRSPQYSQLANNLALAEAGKLLQEETNQVEQSDVIAAQSRVRQAELAVQAAQVAYARTIVKAPFSGIITEVNVNKGDRMSTQTPLAGLKNVAALELEFGLSQAEARSLAVGDSVMNNGQAIAVVQYVSPDITQSGVVRVLAELFPTPNLQTKEGEQLSVTLIPSQNQNNTDAYTVPVTAIVMQGREAFVVMVDRFSQAMHMPVTIQRVNGQWVTLTQPLTRAVIKDARGITDQTLVSITTQQTNGIEPVLPAETEVMSFNQ